MTPNDVGRYKFLKSINHVTPTQPWLHLAFCKPDFSFIFLLYFPYIFSSFIFLIVIFITSPDELYLQGPKDQQLSALFVRNPRVTTSLPRTVKTTPEELSLRQMSAYPHLRHLCLAPGYSPVYAYLLLSLSFIILFNLQQIN